VVLGAIGLWMRQDLARAAREQAAAARDVPVLPAGRLKLLRSGMNESWYLALDEVRPTEGGVAATVLTVAKSPTGLEGGFAMVTRRETVACDQQRIFEGRLGYFAVDGRLASATNAYSGARGRPVEPSDLEVPELCHDAGKGHVVTGFRAAQHEAQLPPDNFEAAARAHPDDADALAWLCAAGARGHWRPTTPGDCDRAVKLRPQAAATRLDRGFLRMLTSTPASADAEFRKVIADDPANAAALYGHSLILALGGDEAGSRRARGRALDLDPTVAEWVIATYRLQVSKEYRNR